MANDHQFEVIVVGAGGAATRTAGGIAPGIAVCKVASGAPPAAPGPAP